jgi:DNA-directed RNA polymerase
MMMLSAPLTPSDDLITQQYELETEMTQQGIERFRAINKKAVEGGREDSTVYGKSLMDGLIQKVADGVAAFMAERSSGKAGRKGPAFKYLAAFNGDYDVVSFIALRLVLGGLLGTPPTVPAVAGRIGRAIEDEFRYRDVREQDKKFYDRLRDEASKRSAYHIKRKVVNMFLARREVDLPDNWPEADVVLLGMLMVEVVIATTGVVYKEKVETRAKQSKLLLLPTEETKTFIKDRSASAETMRPIYEPMIVPPVDWTGPFNGGYLTRRVRPLRLVKSFSRKYLASLETQDLSEVCEAVNAAQQTEWAINPFILTVLEMAWEKDYSLGGIPSVFDTPLPPKPHDIEENETARKEWRSEAHMVHIENLELTSKRATFYSTMNVARRYSHFETLYFPYLLDFRGRIYAAPLLNPQGPDWMKALLHFAKGMPLDEESAPFLAIHVANTGAFNKIDKAPLEDRVQWVYENEEAIIACAENPFDNRWWTEADSPYLFLAACREWAGWCREGAGFISHLPVALDGSCSGIQHFSMALADEVGGDAVNLVPSDKPSDIYTLVLVEATKQATADAAGGGEDADVASSWLRSGLFSRNLVKRPTMTYGYGSNQFGFREQIFTDTLRPAYKEYQRGNAEWHFEGNGFAASVYMARVIIQAVERTVLKAAEAMAWLKAVAGVVTSEQLPVRWTTPDGFLVVQNYREQKTHRIDTMLMGSRVTAQVQTDMPAVDKRKQASGFSPNFVHSLDASHLRLTVRRAAQEGIKDFALVHDSFGTHAANTGRFFAILRETMVEMYRGRDVMQNLHTEILSQLSPENQSLLPQPPAMGQLDIEAVVDCDFAFA